MKRALFSLFVLLIVGVPAVAQDAGGSRVFAGFSFVDIAKSFENAAGFQGSYTHPLFDSLDFTADVGVQTGTLTFFGDFQTYEFLFGPQVRGRVSRFEGFAHALAGAAHFRQDGGTFNLFGNPITIPAVSETGFALGFGGGLDLKLSNRVAFRIIQLDYIPAHMFGDWTHNFRGGIGVVFKFGGR